MLPGKRICTVTSSAPVVLPLSSSNSPTMGCDSEMPAEPSSREADNAIWLSPVTLCVVSATEQVKTLRPGKMRPALST